MLTAVPLAIKFKNKLPITHEPISLEGIPYHQNNGTIGTWMGFDRSEVAQFKSVPVVANEAIDKNMLFFVNQSFKLYVDNPAQLGVIDNIKG